MIGLQLGTIDVENRRPGGRASVEQTFQLGWWLAMYCSDDVNHGMLDRILKTVTFPINPNIQTQISTFEIRRKKGPKNALCDMYLSVIDQLKVILYEKGAK